MKHNKAEIRDLKCRLCGTTWLKYIQNKSPCRNSFLEDGRHNFDLGKPIRVDPQETEASMSDDKVHGGKIIFQ
jgi:hypothetical protein